MTVIAKFASSFTEVKILARDLGHFFTVTRDQTVLFGSFRHVGRGRHNVRADRRALGMRTLGRLIVLAPLLDARHAVDVIARHWKIYRYLAIQRFSGLFLASRRSKLT